jgi:hypothetical protein
MKFTPDELEPGMLIIRNGTVSTAEAVSQSPFNDEDRAVKWKEERAPRYYRKDHKFTQYIPRGSK